MTLAGYGLCSSVTVSGEDLGAFLRIFEADLQLPTIGGFVETKICSCRNNNLQSSSSLLDGDFAGEQARLTTLLTSYGFAGLFLVWTRAYLTQTDRAIICSVAVHSASSSERAASTTMNIASSIVLAMTTVICTSVRRMMVIAARRHN